MLIQMFLYLQVLDLITTLLGFRIGASEASPFIRTLVSFGAAGAVVLSKVLAIGLGAVCVWLKRDRLLGLVNYWYAGLVVWNLCIIMRLLTERA